jgi:hypothetical protein
LQCTFHAVELVIVSFSRSSRDCPFARAKEKEREKKKKKKKKRKGKSSVEFSFLQKTSIARTDGALNFFPPGVESASASALPLFLLFPLAA